MSKNSAKHPFKLMGQVYRYILPEVRTELSRWRERAETIPTEEYRKQAIASMTSKQFHCEGGAVYATLDLSKRHIIIPLIVAFQTISDYLDNLCDRSISMDGRDFRQLHQAMLDAVSPNTPLHAYYAWREEQDDGGYLEALVQTCRTCIAQLPSYEQVQSQVMKLVGLYCDLQVYKHVQHEQREPLLLQWWRQHERDFPELHWNEFAAATGSTLGVFMLFQSASASELDRHAVDEIENAYFPSICGLHILLDYLIDQEEDRIGGDLNFCSYYEDEDEVVTRISLMTENARKCASQLEHASFHRMIVEGLIALYLSDPKVRSQKHVKRIARKLMRRSPWTRIFFWLNSVWIRKVF